MAIRTALALTRYSGSEVHPTPCVCAAGKPPGDGPGETTVRALGRSVADQPRRYQPAGHGPLYLSCSGKTMAHEQFPFYTPANHLLPTLFGSAA